MKDDCTYYNTLDVSRDSEDASTQLQTIMQVQMWMQCEAQCAGQSKVKLTQSEFLLIEQPPAEAESLASALLSAPHCLASCCASACTIIFSHGYGYGHHREWQECKLQHACI